MSSHLEKQVIPPDALYTSNEKMMKSNAGYISYEHVFNDSKVRKAHRSMEKIDIIW